MKGSIQIDFIIAVSIFIGMFAIVVQTMTTFFKNAESSSEIDLLTAQANSLLSLLDFDSVPAEWNSTNLKRLGISTAYYRFYIIVNNTKPFYYNQNEEVTDLATESISFNYSNMGFNSIDINSTAIYEDGEEIPYSIDAGNITFLTSIQSNQVKIFTVYFDDDSNFTSRSASLSGKNNITETVHGPQIMRVIQYKKLQLLNNSNYSEVKGSLSVRDFHITISNIDKTPNSVFFDYGGQAPAKGDVVSLQRYFLFQNSTAGIEKGKLTVQTW